MHSPPTSAELTCQELVELVTEYLEGALAPAQRRAFEAHVAACPGCAAYLAQIRATLSTVRETARLERRPEVAALLHAFRDFQRSR